MNAPKEYVLNAAGLKLGRLASGAAKLLMGKGSPDFVKNKVARVKVRIEGVSKLLMDERRLSSLRHERYSGFPGGRRSLPASKIIAQKGYAELIRHAIFGMLPKNKLRTLMMKNLSLSE